MNVSSRSVSSRTGGGLRVASLARYAECSFSDSAAYEKCLEDWRQSLLHIE
jgi:hypothetical protein